MKKIKMLSIIGITALFASCNQISQKSGFQTGYTEFENQIAKKCYETDATSSFAEFLKNPDENVRAIRSARAAAGSDAKNVELSEEEMFARLWESLDDEEKNNILSNTDELNLSVENFVSVDKESEAGRAIIIDEDSSVLDQAAAMYGFMYRLQDLFKGISVSSNYLPEEIRPEEETEVPLVQTIEYCVQQELWDNVEKILKAVDSSVSVNELKEEYEQMKEVSQEIVSSQIKSARASSVVGYKQNALINNLGSNMADGTVLLCTSNKKAFAVAGDWMHAGIFSKKDYTEELGDGSHCVYTAQPNSYDDFPENMKPDKPGYACLDTVYMYTRQRRMATLLPKSYSEAGAKKAVNTAKTVFYDKEPAYNLPWWEMFFIGNSSHDETAKNTYCSKVAYTAWKKAGVNLDGNTFAGNIVSPDDLYGSSVNRYVSLEIGFLFWRKKWTWQTYAATSNILLKKSQ